MEKIGNVTCHDKEWKLECLSVAGWGRTRIWSVERKKSKTGKWGEGKKTQAAAELFMHARLLPMGSPLHVGEDQRFTETVTCSHHTGSGTPGLGLWCCLAAGLGTLWCGLSPPGTPTAWPRTCPFMRPSVQSAVVSRGNSAALCLHSPALALQDRSAFPAYVSFGLGDLVSLPDSSLSPTCPAGSELGM